MPDSSPQGLLLQSMGGWGSEYLTGLNSITGKYFGVQAFEDCTMMGLTVGNVSSSDPQNDGISGAIIPKGATLFGQFTAVQLSGKAVLYKYDT
jgi:hypothetical protein